MDTAGLLSAEELDAVANEAVEDDAAADDQPRPPPERFLVLLTSDDDDDDEEDGKSQTSDGVNGEAAARLRVAQRSAEQQRMFEELRAELQPWSQPAADDVDVAGVGTGVPPWPAPTESEDLPLRPVSLIRGEVASRPLRRDEIEL